MQLWLSQYITEGLNGWPNKPNNILRSQMASQLAGMVAIYSTSTELNATDYCFRLNHDTTAEPNPKQHPEVLFLSEAQPAQSESV